MKTELLEQLSGLWLALPPLVGRGQAGVEESPGMNTAQGHDLRTEDQKVAAVAASMTMAGQPVTADDESRGELTADQAALEILEEEGLSGTPRAAELRRRIARGA